MSGNSPAELGFVKTSRATSGVNARDQAQLELAVAMEADPVLRADLWLAERIVAHTGIRQSLFAGALHDSTERRERLRKSILENGLSSVGLGKHGGKFETYGAHFRRRFGEDL